MTASGGVAARLAEARLALTLLTRLPVGRIDPCPPIGASAWAWPLAGLAVGCAQALMLAAPLPPAVAAGLAVGLGLMLTGALHEDGLADLTDGLSGGRDPDRRLEIMRDSRIGSHGAAALIMVLGLRWAALAALADQGGGAVIAAAMLSRGMLPLLNGALPQARDRGFGAAAVQGATRGRCGVALILGGLAALAVWPVGVALAAIAAAAAAAAVVGALARRRLGGLTGDVLGAAQVAAEIAVLSLAVAGV